jgi:hypothetical protein
MVHDATRWLLLSAGLEIFVSSLLGYAMLIPLQPWAAHWRPRWPSTRGLMSVHLDLVMLGLSQGVAAFGMHIRPAASDHLSAALLISSGWLNVTPYVWRLAGVDAFVLAGGALQKFAATLSLASTLALTGGWGLMVWGWL